MTSCWVREWLVDAGQFADLLSAIGPGSPARSTTWIPAGGGTASIIGCQSAYQAIVQAFPALTTAGLNAAAPSFYPNLPAASAVTQLKNDLPTMAQAYYGGTSMSAQTIFQQRSLVNAFMEARANFGSGGGDTFAALHADVQAQNSYISAARQAMTWVPVLNLVLTIVFYAMFPVVFPLFLFPQTGPALLEGLSDGLLLSRLMGADLCGAPHVHHAIFGGPAFRAGPQWHDHGDDGGHRFRQPEHGNAGGLPADVRAGDGRRHGQGRHVDRLEHHRHAGTRDARGRGRRGRADHRQLCLWQQPVPERDRPSGQHRAHLECGGQPVPQVNMRGDNGTITSTMPDGSTVYNTSGAISRFGFSASEMQSVTGNLQQSGAQYHTRANAMRETSAERWSHGMRTLDSLVRFAPCER
jgi:conjugal transfer mating pair stabilization protein TraG